MPKGKGEEQTKVKILEDQAKTLNSVITQLRLTLQNSSRENVALVEKNSELEKRVQNLVFEKECLQKQLFRTEDSAPVPKERASGSKTKTLETKLFLKVRRLFLFLKVRSRSQMTTAFDVTNLKCTNVQNQEVSGLGPNVPFQDGETISPSPGEIAQLVRVLVCHARSRGSESRFPRPVSIMLGFPKSESLLKNLAKVRDEGPPAPSSGRGGWPGGMAFGHVSSSCRFHFCTIRR